MNILSRIHLESANESLKEFATHVLSTRPAIKLSVEASTLASLFLIAERHESSVERMIMQWVVDRLHSEETRLQQ